MNENNIFKNSILLTAMLAITTVAGYSMQPSIIAEETSQMMNPQEINYTYFSVNEGSSLSFTRGWGPYGAETINITPYNLPSGATMPGVPNIVGVRIYSTFNWIPTYCQASPSNYSFNIDFWRSSFPFAPISKELGSIQVVNLNRPPLITTYIPSRKYLPVGQSWQLNLAATNADKAECNDDSIVMSYTYNPVLISASFFDLGGGTATFSWTAQQSDIGDHTLKFRATDSNGAFHEKEVLVTVYQPVYSPSCWYNKLRRTWTCA